jgi:hypothetical protein
MNMKTFLSLALGLGMAFSFARGQNCSVQASSITQNFTGMAQGSRPPCWQSHYLNNGNTFSGVYSGESRYWLMYNDGGSPANSLPPLPFTLVMHRCTVKGPLAFELRGYTAGSSRPLEIGTMSDPNNPATFTTFQTYYWPNSTPTTINCDLTSYVGTDEYIAFRAWLSNGNNYILDNIVWSGPSPIVIPPVIILPPKGPGN